MENVSPPTKKRAARTRFCFTLNNYSETEYNECIHKLQAAAPHFAVVAREVGESGNPHLQGFVHFTKKIHFVTAKSIFGARSHIEGARGTDEQNDIYCSKYESTPFRIGSPQRGTTERGGGYVLQYQSAKIIQQRLDGVPFAEIFANEELQPACIQHYRTIRDITGVLSNARALTGLRASFASFVPRHFQSSILRRLADDPHPRTILWYWEPWGASGKSYFSRYLVATQSALRLENGKSGDIKHAYTGQRVVIFDYSRSQQEHINYEVLESIKNGCIFNTKYESEMRIYPHPHVLCFANFPPDETKLSQDRWMIHEITDSDKKQTVIV